MRKKLKKEFLKVLDKISTSDKREIYLELFLDYLKRKRMIHYLPAGVKIFKRKKVQRYIVDIETAREISEINKKELESLVRNKINERAIIHYRINPKLIGGFRIKSSDLLLDYSVKKYLEQLFNF